MFRKCRNLCLLIYFFQQRVGYVYRYMRHLVHVLQGMQHLLPFCLAFDQVLSELLQLYEDNRCSVSKLFPCLHFRIAVE